MIDGVNSTSELLLSLAAIGGVLLGGWKFFWYGKGDHQPGVIKAAIQALHNVNDTIVGRDAIVDHETGRELVSAKPGIGTRMANTEETMGKLAEAVTKLADTHERVTELDHRVSVLERTVGVERALGKIESIQMLSTIEAVANGGSPDTNTIQES